VRHRVSAEGDERIPMIHRAPYWSKIFELHDRDFYSGFHFCDSHGQPGSDGTLQFDLMTFRDGLAWWQDLVHRLREMKEEEC